MHRSIALILTAALSLTGAAVRAAQPVESDFVVSLRGLKVGSFHLSARQNDTSYEATARIEDAGLLNVFRSFFYHGLSRGGFDAGRPVPLHFEEDSDTGRRRTEAVLDYDGGVPKVTRYGSSAPAAPDSPVPATQGGTLDPVTALFVLFRDQPPEAVCDTTVAMYDGMRSSHVVLGKPRRDGAMIRCAGEYRRLKGFTAKDLSRNVAFPLVFTFEAIDSGLMRVVRVDITSSYGLATLDRR